VQVVSSVTPCLAEPPPVERSVTPTVDESCPKQFVLCLEVDAGLDLEYNIRTTRRWMKEAWARCGTVLDAGVMAFDAGD
jgi:hypothetical protein